LRKNDAPISDRMRYPMPKGRNALVGTSLLLSMRPCAIGDVRTAPKPNPPTASPVMSPRLSGNHFCSMAIGTM